MNREAELGRGCARIACCWIELPTRTHKVSGIPVRDCAPAVGASCAPDSVCVLSFVLVGPPMVITAGFQ